MICLCMSIYDIQYVCGYSNNWLLLWFPSYWDAPRNVYINMENP